MALKIGSKDPLGQSRHERRPDRCRAAGKERKPPARPFGEVLAEKDSAEAEWPVELRTHPLGWTVSKEYASFAIGFSEGGTVFWKESHDGSRTKAGASEIARFKKDIAATAEGNPVIASILASCEALRG